MNGGTGLAEGVLGLDGFRVLEVTETAHEVVITVETPRWPPPGNHPMNPHLATATNPKAATSLSTETPITVGDCGTGRTVAWRQLALTRPAP
jgi:hypothetical protein